MKIQNYTIEEVLTLLQPYSKCSINFFSYASDNATDPFDEEQHITKTAKETIYSEKRR